MEEKERYYYKKILRDCVMPEGLFEIKDREGNFYLIIENKKDVDTITNLLNQQDKRIKELEEENQQLKDRIGKQFDRIQTLTKSYDVEKEFGDKVLLENQQLKQAQKDRDVIFLEK